MYLKHFDVPLQCFMRFSVAIVINYPLQSKKYRWVYLLVNWIDSNETATHKKSRTIGIFLLLLLLFALKVHCKFSVENKWFRENWSQYNLVDLIFRKKYEKLIKSITAIEYVRRLRGADKYKSDHKQTSKKI